MCIAQSFVLDVDLVASKSGEPWLASIQKPPSLDFFLFSDSCLHWADLYKYLQEIQNLAWFAFRNLIYIKIKHAHFSSIYRFGAELMLERSGLEYPRLAASEPRFSEAKLRQVFIRHVMVPYNHRWSGATGHVIASLPLARHTANWTLL